MEAANGVTIAPRTSSADFSVLKPTRLSERMNFQFRAGDFHILNHPNFALPNVAFNGTAFSAMAKLFLLIRRLGMVTDVYPFEKKQYVFSYVRGMVSDTFQVVSDKHQVHRGSDV